MGRILNMFLKGRSRPPTEASTYADTDSLKRRSAQAIKNNEKEGVVFPPVLLRRIVSSAIVCVIISAIVVGLVIGTKDTTFCFGFIFPLYLAYVAVSTWYDYRNGKIEELVLVCVTVTTRFSAVEIIMEDVLNEKTYRFYDAKNNCPFVPGMVYTVYVKKSNPNRIIEHVVE